MSSWVRALVFTFVGSFATLAFVLAVQGAFKAAAGALVVAALLSPVLLDAWRPGRYVLRKPADESPDNLIGRSKQFRKDHPGMDGTHILVVLGVLALLLFATVVIGLVKAMF